VTATFPQGVHYVTDRRRLHGASLERVVEFAVAGGVAAVHLREPDLPVTALFALAERLRGLTGGRCALVINDRVDVALAVAADGVQLGYGSLPVAAARCAAGDRLRIGRSVHSVSEAIMAEREGADFVLLGTLYATESHPEAAPAGLELVKEARAAVRIPVIGIGGITAAKAGAVMAAGADGVAVIGAIQSAPDAEAAAREIVRVVESRWVDGTDRI
jgi:thiamine-phosphate pyrophosphorylase